MNSSSKPALQFLLVATGLMAGILLESKVFHPNRSNPARDEGRQPVEPVASDARDGASANVSAPVTSQNTTGRRPKISVDQTSIDIGMVETGDKISRVFVVKNIGSAPLLVSSVSASCGCTTADISGTTIEPGATTELKVALDLKGRSGPQNSVVSVWSNDPLQSELRLSLVGSAVSRVSLSPAQVDAGRVLPDSTMAAIPVRVRIAQGLSLNIVTVESSSPAIVAKLGDPTENPRQVYVSVLQDSQPGPLRGWVKLLTDHSEQYREILIPVTAYVGQGGPILPGDRLELAGPTLTGGTVSLAEYRGKVCIVVFWASWCGHCQKELPELVKLQQDLGSKGLEILGVNVDRKAEAGLAAIRKVNATWSNIHIDAGEDETAPNPLMLRHQISGIPAVFVVNRNGHVVHNGLRGPGLKPVLERLLVQETAAVTKPRD